MGEKKKSGKTGALRGKSLFTGQKSLLLQCVQMAYIATKASKITKLHELSLLQKGVIWEANKK